MHPYLIIHNEFLTTKSVNKFKYMVLEPSIIPCEHGNFFSHKKKKNKKENPRKHQIDR